MTTVALLGTVLATCSAGGLHGAGLHWLIAAGLAGILTFGAATLSIAVKRTGKWLYGFPMVACVAGAILTDGVYLSDQIIGNQPTPEVHQVAADNAAALVATLEAESTALRADWQAELETGDGPKAKALQAALVRSEALLEAARHDHAQASKNAAEAATGLHAAMRLASAANPARPDVALALGLLAIAGIVELTLLALAWSIGDRPEKAGTTADAVLPVIEAPPVMPLPIAPQFSRQQALGRGLDSLIRCPDRDRLN